MVKWLLRAVGRAAAAVVLVCTPRAGRAVRRGIPVVHSVVRITNDAIDDQRQQCSLQPCDDTKYGWGNAAQRPSTRLVGSTKHDGDMNRGRRTAPWRACAVRRTGATLATTQGGPTHCRSRAMYTSVVFARSPVCVAAIRFAQAPLTSGRLARNNNNCRRPTDSTFCGPLSLTPIRCGLCWWHRERRDRRPHNLAFARTKECHR